MSTPRNFDELEKKYRDYRTEQDEWYRQSKALGGFWPVDGPMRGYFEEHLEHDKYEVAEARVLLVGRVYSAVRNTKDQLAIAGVLNTNHKRVDAAIGALRDQGGFNKKTRPTVVQKHKELNDLGRKATKTSYVSFFAKYLSFHAPHVVPPYDRQAREAAWPIAKSKVPSARHAEDWSYDLYCECLLVLIDALGKRGCAPVDLKVLDASLYARAK